MQCFQSHTQRQAGAKAAFKRAVALTLLSTALVVMGCAPGAPLPAQAPSALTCDLQSQPKCLATCSQHLEVMSPTCDRGIWRCAQGIDSRVCCDVDLAPEACPVWAHECDSDPAEVAPTEDTPEPDVVEPLMCPAGYTCVNSRTHPIPAKRGVCRLGDLEVPDQMTQCSAADATSADFLPFLDTGPVKVQGMLVIDTVCEDNTCTAGDTCCNECYGSYRLVLDGGVTGAEGATMPILTESIACMGTNCGITCAPMQPGRRYLIWGTYRPSELDGNIGQLYHVGHCPL